MGSELADNGDQDLQEPPRQAIRLDQVGQRRVAYLSQTECLTDDRAGLPVRQLPTGDPSEELRTDHQDSPGGHDDFGAEEPAADPDRGWWRPRSEAIGTIAVSVVSRWKSFAGVAPNRRHSMGRALRPITRVIPMAAATTSAGTESPQTTIHTRLLKITPVSWAAAQAPRQRFTT